MLWSIKTYRMLQEALVSRPEFDKENDIPSEEEVKHQLEEYLRKIPRTLKKKDMPQIPEDAYETGRFDRLCKGYNVTKSDEAIPINQITPTQVDLNLNRCMRQATMSGYKRKPLLVIRGNDGVNRLIDGHHKWGALWCKGKLFPDNDGEWNHVPCVVLKGDFSQILNILRGMSDTIEAAPTTQAEKTLKDEQPDKEKLALAKAADDLFGSMEEPAPVTSIVPATPQKLTRTRRATAPVQPPAPTVRKGIVSRDVFESYKSRRFSNWIFRS